MHSDVFLDHFRNPRNVGQLPPPAVTVEIENPACGDVLRLSARWEGDRVAEARYQVRGCSASIAAGSALAGWLPGKTRSELSDLRAGDLDAAVGGLAPESHHAAALCIDGVRALLRSAGA